MAKVPGVFKGRNVEIWDGFGPRDNYHTFSQEELDALFAGKTIAFVAHSKRTGNDYVATGYLGDGDRGFGFILDFNATPDVDFTKSEELHVPHSFCGVQLTDEQRSDLENGARVHLDHMVSSAGNEFSADLAWEDDPEHPGRKHIALHFDD